MALKRVSPDIAFSKKYPTPVVLVTSVDKQGKPNIIALGWFMQTSFDPLMLAISIGNTRYSNSLVKETGEFVLAYPSEEMADALLYCGTHSGKDVDKFKETKLTAVKSRHVRPPLIASALANFECKVISGLKTGDHTIFTGQVLAAYLNDKETKKLYTIAKRTLAPL